MNRVQSAARHIEQAIEHLREAKHDLLVGRHSELVPVAVQLAALEEIHDIITDPECTPEIMAGINPIRKEQENEPHDN